MVIAIPYDENTKNINDHFGHCGKVALYELDESGAVADSAIIENTYGEGHAQMYELLCDYYTDVVICNHIGKEAIDLLEANSIAVYAGVTGTPDEAVALLVQNLLKEAEGSSNCSCGGTCGSSCKDGASSCGGCCGGCH